MDSMSKRCPYLIHGDVVLKKVENGEWFKKISVSYEIVKTCLKLIFFPALLSDL